MNPYASYEITLLGKMVDIQEAISCITDVICDQSDIFPYLLDKYYPAGDEFDDDDDCVHDEDTTSHLLEETIEIWQTQDCVWLEDVEKLAKEIATSAPSIEFSISGHIEDSSDKAGDEMNFKITYKDRKLFSQATDWYQYIHMDKFENYNAFLAKFCDSNRNPRYAREDFERFRDCADEWYVLDGGYGEFSTEVPFKDPVRVKLKFPK